MFGSKHQDIRFNDVRRVLALVSAAAIGVVGSVSLLATSASAEDAAPAADETTPASASDNGSPAAPTTDPAPTAEATPSSTEAAAPSSDAVANPDSSSASSSASPSKAPQSNAKVAPKAVIEGDFGVGKVRVRVEATSGNYPVALDLSGATVEMRDITDPAAPVGTCTTDSNGICGVTESAFFFTSLVADHDYEVRQTSASANFLADPEIVTFTASPDICDGAGGCNSIVFEQVGAYRTVAVQKLSTVSGSPVAGATYVLCTPAPAPLNNGRRAAVDPTPGDPANGACPIGMNQAATATTDSGGRAYFSGVYAAGEGYALFESTAAPGYKLDPNLQAFSVPAATTVAQVDQTVFVNVTNKPDVPAPVAINDAVSVTAGGSVIIRALDNDNGRGATAFIVGFSLAEHGTVQYLADSTCAAAAECPEVLVYTPAAGYTGTDTFLYTILTRGGSSTARVTITVIAAATPAAPVTESNGTALAYTGVDGSGLVTSALGLIGAGSLLLAGGAIQRRRQLAGTHS